MDHERAWSDAPERGSSSRHVRMPIFRDGQRWATMEIAFAPVPTATLVEAFLERPATRLVLGMAVLGFLGHLLFIRRILRHLDPSEVVPARVQTALDVMADGVLLLDDEERIVVANVAFGELCERKPSSLVGLAASSLGWRVGNRRVRADDLPWTETLEHGASLEDRAISLQVEARRETVELRANASPVLDGWERPKGAIVTFRDVSELERQRRALEHALAELEKSREEIRLQNEELEVLAQTDALTGVINRGTFMARFAQHFDGARRQDRALCCMMVDIDHFKRVNDEHGHAVGDEVIQVVAQALDRHTRAEDLVGRYGGEEFCVALPGLSPDMALEVGERIRLAIAAPGFARLPVTVSIGISSSTYGAKTPEALIDEADQCLYVSKNEGRNRVTRYDRLIENRSRQA